MPLIPESSIQTLRRLKAEDYSDQVTRLVFTPHTGDLGHGKPTYPDGKIIACRFVAKPSPDVLPGADVQMADADLHFGREVTLNPHDRVRLTHLHGDKITARDYAIIAGPVLDSLGNRATLKLVQE